MILSPISPVDGIRVDGIRVDGELGEGDMAPPGDEGGEGDIVIVGLAVGRV